MVYRDDPSGRQELADLKRRIAALETQSPLRSSSITSGRLRVGGSAILLVDSDGGIVVEGRLTGTGTLEWTETVNLKGTTTITGPTTITGALTAKGATRFEGDTTQVGAHHVQGNQDITGTLAVKGAATLENNLTLNGANAKITAGVVSLDNGGTLRSTNALLIVAAGLTSVQNNMYVGGTFTAGGQATLSNLITNTTTGTTYVVANASTGLLQRVSSASRFKLDQREAELPDALLDVRVKDWLDAGEVATAFELESAPRPWTYEQSQAFAGLGIRRVPGVVAEDVHAAGGELFNTFDAEGHIEGVAYDRLAIARTQILADRLDAALKRIEELEERLDA